jgi:hypothetical protein
MILGCKALVVAWVILTKNVYLAKVQGFQKGQAVERRPIDKSPTGKEAETCITGLQS